MGMVHMNLSSNFVNAKYGTTYMHMRIHVPSVGMNYSINGGNWYLP